MTNEAAERLLNHLDARGVGDMKALANEAIAAERRAAYREGYAAALAQIRARAAAARQRWGMETIPASLARILDDVGSWLNLDEETAR